MICTIKYNVYISFNIGIKGQCIYNVSTINKNKNIYLKHVKYINKLNKKI